MRHRKKLHWLHSLLVLSLLWMSATVASAQSVGVVALFQSVDVLSFAAHPMSHTASSHTATLQSAAAQHPCADPTPDRPCAMDCCEQLDCSMDRCSFGVSFGIWPTSAPAIPQPTFFQTVPAISLVLTPYLSHRLWTVWRPPRTS